jgi:sugar porter (SP) family MFS transporter
MQTKSFISYWSAFIACIGGFLQSYATCVIAGALPFIAKEFGLSPLQEGNIASLILIGALAAALFSGVLADHLGRKKCLNLSALLYIATSAATLFVESYGTLCLLRIVTGFAVGMSSILVPLYLAEISPAAKRGAFVGGYQLFVTIGTLIAYLVNLLYSDAEDWRMMLFATGFAALFQWVFLFRFPESPKWLKARGRFEEANQTLQQLNLPQEEDKQVTPEPLFRRCFARLLLIGFALCFFAQFSGINALIYFSPRIFLDAGFESNRTAIAATLLVGVVNVIAGLITVLIIDKVGRRKMLLLSQMGVLSMLFLLIVSFATENAFVDKLAVGGVVIYVFFYALGFGPIVPILVSEIFPLSIRAKAISIVIFISWLSNYLIVLTFPSLNAHLGASGTFGLYAASTLVALLFSALYIPETKGKSLEELERELVRRD